MSNADYIWKWLYEKIGNDCGVAGLMGNLCAESSLNPENLQNSYERLLGMADHEYTEAVDNGSYSEEDFCNDQAGYGLAQWTHRDRKRGLYSAAKKAGTSIGDLDMQLGYLWDEILGNKYVLLTLYNAKSIREASDAVMLKYEIPADLSEDNKASRADLGQVYYERYAIGSLTKNENAEKIVQLAISRLGCKYVYGAKGEEKNGEQVFDCRGFTWWLLQQVGIDISPVGATTQYNTISDWDERGYTKDIPNLVCPVFKYRASDNKMAHTGMHIGDGVIIHCTENGGVKYGDLSDTTWTHYAIPKGLYTQEEIDHARGRELVRTLKSGCSGEDVKWLQKTLNELGFKCGNADGIFGSKTKTAVMAFQSAYGLKADGIVGTKTRSELQKAIGEDYISSVDSVKLTLTLSADIMRKVLETGNLVIDCRSGNVSNIDYQ